MVAFVGGCVYVANMTTTRRLRLATEHATKAMLAAIADAPGVQAADLRAHLISTDPARVSMETVAQVSGISHVPMQHFFEEIPA